MNIPVNFKFLFRSPGCPIHTGYRTGPLFHIQEHSPLSHPPKASQCASIFTDHLPCRPLCCYPPFPPHMSPTHIKPERARAHWCSDAPSPLASLPLLVSRTGRRHAHVRSVISVSPPQLTTSFPCPPQICMSHVIKGHARCGITSQFLRICLPRGLSCTTREEVGHMFHLWHLSGGI